MAVARGGDHAGTPRGGGCVDHCGWHIIATMHDAHITPTPPDDEAAAVVAVLAAYLAGEDQSQSVAQEATSGWQQSAKLQVQGLQPMRTACPPRWNTVERLRRASSFGGVTG